ncbi:MAG TPA: RDD family protein [Burkholderiales bacterium]|nr:RDD family protein [Burkholderiales bacterium]
MADQAYGGFWIRVLAYLVDSVVVFSAVIVLAFVAAFLGDIGKALIPLICLLTPLLYWGLMQASARQATFGKALLGMKVTDTSGNRISLLRSLGRELAKWVSGIPLGLGYVMVAFTGRKQALHDMVAATTVTRESSGHVLIALLVGVLGWIMPAALAMFIGGALIAVMMGTMGGDILRQASLDSPKRVSAPRASSAPKPAPAAAPAARAPQPAEPAPPPADVETIVAAQLAGFEKPGTTRAGPAVLEIDQTFLFGSDFTIKAYLPPYRELRGRSIALQINSVLDARNANIYDAANSFEKDPFFTSIDLSAAQSPVNHLEGRRRVRLKKGADAKSVDRVEGIAHLNIAQNPQAIAFGRADVGKSKAAAGVQVVMKAVKDRQVELQFGGDHSRVLSARGLGADDSALRIESTTMSGDSTSYVFAAAPEKVEVFVAESFVKRSFPFTLARNTVAPPPGAAQVAAAPAEAPKAATVPAKTAAVAEAPKPPIQARTVEPPVTVERMAAQPGPKYNDLMSAVMAADPAAVQELLAFGKWPDKPDAQGVTPLMMATMRGDRRSAELLLEAGADPDRPLSWSHERGDPAMTTLLERYSTTSKRP